MHSFTGIMSYKLTHKVVESTHCNILHKKRVVSQLQLRCPGVCALVHLQQHTSVRMMSAAPLAAEVEPATAMPTLAFFSAGASFTPSPAATEHPPSDSRSHQELVGQSK